jgi:hypothetical protein
VIGKAANTLSPALVAAHPEVPREDVIAPRHVPVHSNLGVDLALSGDSSLTS